MPITFAKLKEKLRFYVFVITKPHDFQLTEGSFGEDPVLEGPLDLLDGHQVVFFLGEVVFGPNHQPVGPLARWGTKI